MSAFDVLERFHRALVDEIRSQRPEYLSDPFTVAEIYQNLVPYGSHRDRIGVEMNADYEDALLRLLAGEGGFLVLDSAAALRSIKAELERKNPNTGLYREFAAVDVRLHPAYAGGGGAPSPAGGGTGDEAEAAIPVPMTDLAPVEERGPAVDVGIVPPSADLFPVPDAGIAASPDETGGAASAGESGDAPDASGAEESWSGAVPSGGLQPEFVEPAPASDDSCRWCGGSLPDREGVRFCPYCGTDITLVPCASCGEELEPGWKFCVSCGVGVGG